jgi:DNA-binding protein Fis
MNTNPQLARHFLQPTGLGSALATIQSAIRENLANAPTATAMQQLAEIAIGRGESIQQFLREAERRFILTVLAQCDGNQCKAAHFLGIHRNTLSRTIDVLDIDVRGIRRECKKPVEAER